MIEHEHMPDAARLRELLVGKSIIAAVLTDDRPGVGAFSDGPTGYLCTAGCYPLTHVAAVENIITNVEVEDRPSGDSEYPPCLTCGKTHCYEDDHDNEGHYRIFVFAGDDRINVASFEGSDGNGYYGTGWWLRVIATGADHG